MLIITIGIKAFGCELRVMAGENGSTHGIRKFDNTILLFWKMQIQDYFYNEKLHLPLLGTKPEKMLDGD